MSVDDTLADDDDDASLGALGYSLRPQVHSHPQQHQYYQHYHSNSDSQSGTKNADVGIYRDGAGGLDLGPGSFVDPYPDGDGDVRSMSRSWMKAGGAGAGTGRGRGRGDQVGYGMDPAAMGLSDAETAYNYTTSASESDLEFVDYAIESVNEERVCVSEVSASVFFSHTSFVLPPPFAPALAVALACSPSVFVLFLVRFLLCSLSLFRVAPAYLFTNILSLSHFTHTSTFPSPTL